MHSNPLLEELWRIREEHAAQFNYDIAAIVEDLRQTEAARDWARASFEPRRVTIIPKPEP